MIGLDISDRSVKMIELEDSANPRLRTACWSALPPNIIRRGIIQEPAQVVSAVQEVMAKCSPVPVSGDAVVASIPETRSFLRVIDLPQMSERETDEAVRWAIRQHIPFDLDRVYIDWQPIISTQQQVARQQILVGAAQREVIDPLLNVLDGLGLRIVALELEAQAIIRSMLPSDNSDVRSILVVDLGATTTNIMYFDRGSTRFTRSIPSGGDDLTQQLARQLHLQPTIAAEKKALVGVSSNADESQIATTLRDATRSLVQQIEQSVHESITTSDQSTLSAILLGGGAANLPGINEVFAEIFPGIPVQLGNPLINVAIGENTTGLPLSPGDAAHFSTAIGLALRQSEKEQQS